MSTKIEYNGSIVATVEGGNTATLPIKDKKMATDILVTVPEVVLQEKTATANGEVTADEGYDGLSKVTVNVPSEEPNLISKTITENGTYKASEEVLDELHGTWVFNDVLSDDSTSRVRVNVNFTCNGFDYYQLVHMWNEDYRKVRLTYNSHTSGASKEVHSANGWKDEAYKTITITSTLAEVENGAAFFNWLKANAMKQGTTITTIDGYSEVVVNVEPDLEEITITENGEYTPSGDGYSKVTVAVPSETVEEWDGAIVIEDIAPEVSLITFTIGGTTYQAVEGMTWYEWCNSDYNTGVFACTSSSAYVTGSSGRNIRTSTSLTIIKGSDYISNGTAYIYASISGGGA